MEAEESAVPGTGGTPGDHPATSHTATGEGESESEGTARLFGGLTAREASERAALARKARREQQEAEREAAQGTSLASKIERALSSLTQSDVDAMVRTLTGSATGAQTLVRLMDVAAGRTEAEGAEGEQPLTHDERARILASFASRAQGEEGESDPASSSTSEGQEGTTGGEGEAPGTSGGAGSVVVGTRVA